MSGEIYIDVVFAANLLMDYILLRILGSILRLKGNGRRCFAAAVTGALFSCFILCIPIEESPLIFVLLLIVPGMPSYLAFESRICLVVWIVLGIVFYFRTEGKK